MFFQNSVSKFDLESVPPIIRRAWEGNQEQKLVELKKRAVLFVRVRLILSALLFAGVCVIFVVFGNAPFMKQQLLGVGVGLALTAIFWLVITYMFPMSGFREYTRFIRSYQNLIKLVTLEWKYGDTYPTGGPGIVSTFENLLPFVTERMTRFGQELKGFTDPSLSHVRDFVLMGENHCESMKRFRKILEPFGLVYPTDDPYLNPESTYLYS